MDRDGLRTGAKPRQAPGQQLSRVSGSGMDISSVKESYNYFRSFHR